MNARLIERRLASRELDGCALLDVVERKTDNAREITLFFDQAVTGDLIVPPTNSELIVIKSIGGATFATYAVPLDAQATFQIQGQSVDLTPAEVETDYMQGTNAIVAERNGEPARLVLEWLDFHLEHQQVQSVAILDRAQPGTDKAFTREMREGLKNVTTPCTIALVSSDIPLGKPDLPQEAHPFCVPGAPGKDRMHVPPPAPWESPLGALTIYEIMRMRFLATARAVANIDVFDLMPAGPESIFDTAVSAENGLITLIGQQCYPWRVRTDTDIKFADHTCVQFDARGGRHRWCIAPDKAPEDAIWRLVRIGNVQPDPTRTRGFYRYMGIRYPNESISKIVPKTSLIEHEPLLEMSKKEFGHKPVRMPKISFDKAKLKGRGRCAIVSTMKNEGPFILEWLAYHRAIGFDDFIIYTNDCTDGTDTMLKLLQSKGILQHRENPFRSSDLKPQHAALQAAEEEDLIKDATWVTCIDVDEFVNIKTGDGTLDALFQAVPDANMISMTWRLFGNGDIHAYQDKPITEQFLRSAPELVRKPHQAWGFKTLFRNVGIFNKLGVHRPKGLKPQLWEQISWVNGSGNPLPKTMFRNGWRSTLETFGYDLVQLNHYAVRSAESFLVKRDRGRVNHVDRDQGLAYWFRMNNNAVEERSIQHRLPMMKAELARLIDDEDIAAAHAHSVQCHKAKIAELKATEKYARFYDDLTGPRLQKLSLMHSHFGSNVFLSGPDAVPDEVVARDPDAKWFFTVKQRTDQ
ncbi:glycosyltransferase family 2 protein [Aliiroseovarius sp. S1339]|uniref:glycosyltransferase family 2 protein n=1 Tax=Aliiroseovarius sp. S1339 TaxID=2936990 RepID=UPI0020BFE605|nr:glycosyltransferase family 2 protein [Aliiroseovarius sp. S1339]MCK8465166.1 glycosyltransferase family 2 protein [Aliiroseovarius sp. S1339]